MKTEEKQEKYIYILTNPSFPNLVKIGYASDVEKRVKDLNSSSAIPFSFRIYAKYKVSLNKEKSENKELPDKQLHKFIDLLNPELRAIETNEGKIRKREFFAIDAEDAYSILESIASINGLENNLEKIEPSDKDKEEEKIAEEVAARAEIFSFERVGIPAGETIEYKYDKNKKAKVHNDLKQVIYEDQLYSLSGLAKKLRGVNYGLRGPDFFKYEGKILSQI